MFQVDGIALRPLQKSDIETLYIWDTDIELSVLGGWVRQVSQSAFIRRWERVIEEPKEDMDWFGIERDGALVGYLQLALIDRVERRAAIGIVVGDKSLWGKGIGSTALRIVLDYAFTVRNLERVYCEVYAYNTRSMRMMERVGFQREGTLRQHEYHNGVRQDTHVYGMLRPEFYARYDTIFKVPES